MIVVVASIAFIVLCLDVVLLVSYVTAMQAACDLLRIPLAERPWYARW